MDRLFKSVLCCVGFQPSALCPVGGGGGGQNLTTLTLRESQNISIPVKNSKGVVLAKES